MQAHRKITFSSVPIEGTPFMLMEHDERMVKLQGFIDVRQIYRKYEKKWLEDLLTSHQKLSKSFCGLSHWWWFGSASRLDVRPLGKADDIKPLMFARSVLAWLENNPDVDELVLVGTEERVRAYLSDTAISMSLNGESHKKTKSFILKNFFKATKKVFLNFIRILKNHVVFSPPSSVETSHIVCYENLYNLAYENNQKYYFSSLLDDLKVNDVSLIVLGIVPKKNRTLNKDNQVSQNLIKQSLLDYCRFSDLFISFFITQYVMILMFANIIFKPRCLIDGVTFKGFWAFYLMKQLELGDVFVSIASYKAMRRLLQSNKIEKLTYPYEEKGIERALLLASQKFKVISTGFTPHPQSQLNLAMIDLDTSSCPTPDQYAFCGSGYIEMFRSWGKKPNAEMQVWGSHKGYQGSCPVIRKERDKFTILVTLNNISELYTFSTWLTAEPELNSDVEFHLRKYWAIENIAYDDLTAAIVTNHKNVHIVEGSLEENTRNADVVMFCATSAGIEAVNYGCIGLYADLNGLFFNEPCLGNMTDWQVTSTAKELVERIKYLEVLDENGMNSLYNTQKEAAELIFAPVAKNIIHKHFSKS